MKPSIGRVVVFPARFAEPATSYEASRAIIDMTAEEWEKYPVQLVAGIINRVHEDGSIAVTPQWPINQRGQEFPRMTADYCNLTEGDVSQFGHHWAWPERV